jgi:7,8-dihydropterin-6-yl-methyl-4-(beta-D-ribofuranosyl)aminobenzene 5'-phosphate synthase
MQIKIIAVGSTKWEMFLCRWGISYLIGQDLLFDTFGDPGVFLHNVKSLNIDLSKIKHIVISHDHWDHIAGLWYVINRFKDINVYICPNFGGKIKERIRSFGVNVVEVSRLLRIKDEIYSTGEIEGSFRNTSISEQALVVNSENGLIVLTGCAHPGILKIIEEVKAKFPVEHIYLVLGGFHLMDQDKRAIEIVAENFKKMGIIKVGPTHCSGKLAEEIFKKTYQDSFVDIKTGQTLEF